MYYCVDIVGVLLRGDCRCITAWRLSVHYCMEIVGVLLRGVCRCITAWRLSVHYCMEIVGALLRGDKGENMCMQQHTLWHISFMFKLLA